MLHRDQEQLDAIRDALVKAELLSSEEAGDLIFHLGDLLDSAAAFPNEVNIVFSHLAQLQTDPQEFEVKLMQFYQTIKHLGFHLFGAVLPLTEAIDLLRIDNDEDDEQDDEGRGIEE